MVDELRASARRQERRRLVAAAVTLAVNLGNFLFLVLVARSAQPAVFGGLAALAGTALVFEVPANALQVAVGRQVSDRKGQGHQALVVTGPLLLGATVWGAGVCALLLALSPLVERFLHLPSLEAALLLGAYALPVGISVVPKGVLAGQGRLSSLACGLVTGTVVRVVVGVVLVRRGGGIGGAFAAMVWGEVVTAAIVLLGLRELLKDADQQGRATGSTEAPAAGGSPTSHLRPRWRDARLPAIAFSGYWAMTAVDVVLARHWLHPLAVSGFYAAAATTAQIALIAPGAIAAVAFPRLIGADVPRMVGPDSRPNQRLMFALGAAVVAVTSFAAAVVVGLLASSTVKALFGAPYLAADQVVGLLSFAAALLGLVTVVLHYHVNRAARWTSLLCWPGVAVVVIGTEIWHRSMTQIAAVMVVGAGVVCAGMVVAALGHREGSRANLVERANLALLDADLDLTVVVPYYNPGRLLVPTIQRLLSVLDNSGASYEVIAVSDGSTDGSERELSAALARHPRLTNLVFTQNQGKGAALRIGLAQGCGRYLGFIDADGDLDPILLDSFQTMVRLYSPDIILGSKRHPLSEVEYPFIRRIYSWGYQQVVRLGFRLNIRDTQTGIKLVRRDVLAAVLPRMVEKRFAFDLELFVIARRLGYKRFLEAPIRLRHQFTSTVSWRAVYRSLLDTMAIWYRLRILHFYDGDQGPATPGGERLRMDPVLLRGGAGTGQVSGLSTSPGEVLEPRPGTDGEVD
ncbi:MAG TPA: glycosyltransferase [Acidimicrobiales bacterium]|nr:glycosyltransferase [Acidimicrobiales bacterium]